MDDEKKEPLLLVISQNCCHEAVVTFRSNTVTESLVVDLKLVLLKELIVLHNSRCQEKNQYETVDILALAKEMNRFYQEKKPSESYNYCNFHPAHFPISIVIEEKPLEKNTFSYGCRGLYTLEEAIYFLLQSFIYQLQVEKQGPKVPEKILMRKIETVLDEIPILKVEEG